MRLPDRLTYANVVSTVCLFILLASGGAAYALARNSVGTHHIRDQAVHTVDLDGGAVTSAKIKDRTVRRADLDPAARAVLPRGLQYYNAAPIGVHDGRVVASLVLPKGRWAVTATGEAHTAGQSYVLCAVRHSGAVVRKTGVNLPESSESWAMSAILQLRGRTTVDVWCDSPGSSAWLVDRQLAAVQVR